MTDPTIISLQLPPPPARGISERRLEWHLENWAAWTRGGGTRSLCMPGRASGLKTGGGSAEFDEMVASSDAKMARDVDALIDDLPLQQQCAIQHRYLHSVWRFPRGNIEVDLGMARLTLRRRIAALGYDW